MDSSYICRSCLAKKDMFTHFINLDVSSVLYTFCTSVEIQDDDLPKSICDNCYACLNQFIQFKKACIQSNNELLSKTVLKKENIKIEAYEPIDCKDTYLIPLNDESSQNNCDSDALSDGEYKEKEEIQRNLKPREKVNKYLASKRVKKKSLHLYKCDICNKKFNDEDRLQSHKDMHEGKDEKIECRHCNKPFKCWETLIKHKYNFHKSISLSLLQCPICGQIMMNPSSLPIHMKWHKLGDAKPHICDKCGRSFKSINTLRQHLKTHEENRVKNYMCTECGRKFYYKHTLMTHTKRHQGRRFICHLCNFPFKQKNNLIRHILMHEGKKLYKCELCAKQFGSSSALIEHKRVHSGEQPYQCKYCPTKFRTRKMVIDHERIHTGEKPNKCKVCEKSFTQAGTLNRHMKTHNKTAKIVEGNDL